MGEGERKKKGFDGTMVLTNEENYFLA